MSCPLAETLTQPEYKTEAFPSEVKGLKKEQSRSRWSTCTH